MTDDARLTPAEDQEVRRLLAEARHVDPAPADVVDRLDRVLAGLVRGDDDATATVTELASHRRRRRATSLLVAAAAVVAVGFGLAQVVGVHGQSADQASDAPAAASTESGEAADNSVLPDAAAGALASVPTPTYALRRAVAIDSGSFSTEVTRLRQRTELRRLDGSALSYDASSSPVAGTAARVPRFDCAPAAWGRGIFVAVRYDGDPGVLVFRRATGDTQVVDLFQCGSADVVRSISLPAH